MQLQHAGLVAMNDMRDGRPRWTPSEPLIGKDSGDMMDGFCEEEYRIFTAPMAAMGEIRYRVMTAQDIEELVQIFAPPLSAPVSAEASTRSSFMPATAISSPPSSTRSSTAAPTIMAAPSRTALAPAVRHHPRREEGGRPRRARLGRGSTSISHDRRRRHRRMRSKPRACCRSGRRRDPRHRTTAIRGAARPSSTGHATDNSNAFVPAAARIRAAAGVPADLPGTDRARGRRSLHCRRQARFRDDGPQAARRPASPRQARRGQAGKRAALHLLLHLHQPDLLLSTGEVRGQHDTGFERERALTPAKSQHIAVVGGGPAGMEAIRRLARRATASPLLEMSNRHRRLSLLRLDRLRPQRGHRRLVEARARLIPV